MTDKMKVAITARMRNGHLWEAAKKMGGMKPLADHLGLPYSTLVSYVNFSLYPTFRNPSSVYDWESIESKLLALTGKLLAEIFPPELAKSEFLARPKVRDVVRDVPVLSLTEASSLAELTAGPEAIEEKAGNLILHDRIIEQLKRLTPREEQILTMRFGLDGQGERDLDEVAAHFKVTRERIRQIEGRALAKLRHPDRSRALKPFLVQDCEHSNVSPGGLCKTCRRLVDYAPPAPDEGPTLEEAIRARQARTAA